MRQTLKSPYDLTSFCCAAWHAVHMMSFLCLLCTFLPACIHSTQSSSVLMSNPDKVVSLIFIAACCIAFVLSIGGVISSWATNIDQGYDNSYLTMGAGSAITFDGRYDDYSGWYLSGMPRVISYGNEKAVGGASVAILILTLLLISKRFSAGIFEEVSGRDRSADVGVY